MDKIDISILYSALINMYYSAYSTKICVVCPAAGFFHHYNLLCTAQPPTTPSSPFKNIFAKQNKKSFSLSNAVHE